jgi:hypothetical protein
LPARISLRELRFDARDLLHHGAIATIGIGALRSRRQIGGACFTTSIRSGSGFSSRHPLIEALRCPVCAGPRESKAPADAPTDTAAAFEH